MAQIYYDKVNKDHILHTFAILFTSCGDFLYDSII